MDTPALFLWISPVPSTPPTMDVIWGMLPQNALHMAYISDICRDSQPPSVISQRVTALSCLLQTINHISPSLLPHIRLQRHENGQPYATWEGITPPNLCFSLSHTHDVAVCAVALGMGHVGVDAEHFIPAPKADKISQRFFTEAELQWLASRPPQDIQINTTKLWTAKEALFKCGGYDNLLATSVFDAKENHFYVGVLSSLEAVVSVCTPTPSPTPVVLSTNSPLVWHSFP